MAKILQTPLYTSNYFLWNNKKYWDWYIVSYWWAWFYYECEKKDIFGSLFSFLVIDRSSETKKIARILVKLNSIEHIKTLNEYITLANERFFFESWNEKDNIKKSILLPWYTVQILEMSDFENLKKTGIFEIYQTNFNLFSGFYANEVEPLDLGLPILFISNEVAQAFHYLERVEQLFTPWRENLKTHTKKFKLLETNSRLLDFFQREIDFQLNLVENWREIIVTNNIYFNLDNKDFIKQLMFAYFQKISSYFSYFHDYKSFADEKQQAEIYKTIYLISNDGVEQINSIQQKIDFFIKNKQNTSSDCFQKIFKTFEKLDWHKLSTQEFFWNSDKFVYPKNLFKPNYWYNGMPDFLFKMNNEKEFFDTFKWLGEEDDIILRYFTYRGLAERILKLTNEQDIKEFLSIWANNPRKYKELLEITKVNIREWTLDLNTFKSHITEYLDDNQKAYLEKHKNEIMKYKSSLPREDRDPNTWEYIPLDKAIKDKFKVTFEDYIIQIEYELFTISYLNFSWYFNITFDYVLYAKYHNIAVWPWRWSAAWAIVSYLTYITDLDSIEYELLFERMLHILKGLDDVPDVDIDFAPDNRYDVIKYMQKKFWEDKVAHIGTYTSSSVKGMIKDLTRGWVIPFENVNMITKELWSKDEEIKENFQSMIDYYQGKDVKLSWDVQAILNKWKRQLQPIFDIVYDLTGFPKTTGIHACWVIVSPVEVETLSPCRFSDGNEVKIWLFDKNEMEHWGLLKYDFLGLNNMQIIKSTIQSILWGDKGLREKYWIKLSDKQEERTNEDWDNLNWYAMYYDIINSIGRDDEDVYNKVFKLGNTTGIFQFESDGMRRSLKWIKPDCITELGDLNALYRPWPKEFIPIYEKIRNEGESNALYSEEFLQSMFEKFWKEETYRNVAFFEEIWHQITIHTKWILIYQEQMMYFFFILGHSYTDADFIRKIFTKIKGWKKSFKDLEKYYNKTMVILEEKNIKKEFFDYIYTEIFVDWAEYGFNKSHSACYSVIAYITAWLKAKYPYNFYAVLLRDCESEPTQTSKIINEMNLLGIDIEWADILKSSKHAILINK